MKYVEKKESNKLKKKNNNNMVYYTYDDLFKQNKNSYWRQN